MEFVDDRAWRGVAFPYMTLDNGDEVDIFVCGSSSALSSFFFFIVVFLLHLLCLRFRFLFTLHHFLLLLRLRF